MERYSKEISENIPTVDEDGRVRLIFIPIYENPLTGERIIELTDQFI